MVPVCEPVVVNANRPAPRSAIRAAWGWLAHHQCNGDVPEDTVDDDGVRSGQSVRQLAAAIELITKPTAELQQTLTSGELKQINSTTCGAASLIVARMLLHPEYAQFLFSSASGSDSNADHNDLRSRFTAQSLAVHRRTTRLIARTGPRLRDLRIRMPWPRAIGTPPWGVRHELEALAGAKYRTVLIDPDSSESRDAAFDLLERSMAGGLPAGLFTGNLLMPRHVTLVIAEGLRVYDPAKGVVLRLNRTDFVNGDLGPVAWTQPWAVVVPLEVGLRR